MDEGGIGALNDGAIAQLNSNEKIEKFKAFVSRGDAVALEDAFRELAIGGEPDFVRALTCALLAKESVRFAHLAPSFLRAVLSMYPEEPAIYFELAVVVPDEQLGLRIRLLEQALDLEPNFFNAKRALVFAYLAAGRLADILELDSDGAIDAGAMLGVLRTLDSEASAEELLSRVVALGQLPGRVGLTRVRSAILDAAKQVRPFALIRLGDGEGAMASFSAEEELRNAALYRANREYFSQRWYGEPLPTTEPTLRKLQAELASTLRTADVIGAPEGEWIGHEARFGNTRSFTCCLNAARFARAVVAGSSILATRTSIHFDLLGSGALAELIVLKRRVALVSCHLALASVLTQRFPDIDVVQSFRIPPAFSDLGQTGYALSRRAYAMVDALEHSFAEVPRDALVLVGGGFVGKLATLRLKAMGFMVLDVGSIFDHVIGYSTRPNFSLYDLDRCFHAEATFREDDPSARDASAIAA
jgi:hypothetical protein